MGIMSAGGTDYELERMQTGKKGTIFLAQKAQQRLGRKIPIIPMGLKEEEDKIILRIGKGIYIKPESDSNYRNLQADKLLKKLEELAS